MDLTSNTNSRRKKSSLDLSTMVYGKIPPQVIQLEQAVLGAMLQFRSAIDDVLEMLTAECFYKEAHGIIFSAIQQLARKSQPVDVLTCINELRTMEKLDLVGGSFYVTQLTNSVVSPAHTVHHCRIIMQKFIQREIIRISGELIGQAYEDSTDAFDLMDQAENLIYAVRQMSIKRPFKFIDTVIVNAFTELEELRHRDQHLTGVTSGFKELDYVTSGWQKADLIILAARPSVGKTSLALTLAKNAALANVPAAVFSLEMEDKRLIHRMLAAEASIWLWKLTNARLDDVDMKTLFTKGVQKLGKISLIIDDTPALSIVEFKAKAKRMVAKHNVGLFIIDYLQLMTAPKDIKNREQQISHLSRELKMTAKELNVPIIALSQLSRDIEKNNKGREPMLSDLRESGAIEQDADVVMFLWPPDDAEIAKDINALNNVKAKIAKHRHGSLAKFVAKFEKETQRWDAFDVVDNKFTKTLGDNWRPVTKDNYQPNLFIEPNKPEQPETGEDLPF